MSDFLSESSNFQNVEALVPLENELRLVQAYLYIQQERFGKRSQVVWQLESETNVLVPSLTMRRAEGGTIHIRIINFDTHLEITVVDNSVGMDEEQLAKLLQPQERSSSSMGLINTHIRLQHHYGQGLRITSGSSKKTSTSLDALPLDEF